MIRALMVANDVMNLRGELSLVRFVGFSIIDSQRKFHLYTQFYILHM